MFVLLSKTLDFFLSPLSWALILLVAAIALRRRPRHASLCTALALALILASANPWVANRLMRWVESGAETTVDPTATYDAVIVLGGGLNSGLSTQTGQLEFNEAPERFLKGFELLEAGRARHILISGGNVFPAEGVPPEATLLAEQLRRWGVAQEKIVVEGSSRNTYENARYTSVLVQTRGWRRLLLITSAAHMPRAEACFRAAGMNVDTLPVDHRSTRLTEAAYLPRTAALDLTASALRELVGRWIYRWKGYAAPPKAKSGTTTTG